MSSKRRNNPDIKTKKRTKKNPVEAKTLTRADEPILDPNSSVANPMEVLYPGPNSGRHGSAKSRGYQTAQPMASQLTPTPSDPTKKHYIFGNWPPSPSRTRTALGRE
jgi:hypothetical protein